MIRVDVAFSVIVAICSFAINGDWWLGALTTEKKLRKEEVNVFATCPQLPRGASVHEQGVAQTDSGARALKMNLRKQGATVPISGFGASARVAAHLDV